MEKKSLVLAVGAALLVTGAFAQDRKKPDPDSVVELYGKIYPELVYPRGSGATGDGTALCTICGTAEGENSVIRRTEMSSSNSRLGVRGHEKLGGGLRAIWQLETLFAVDNPSSTFASRDSWVGLKHDKWGVVKLGRFDTPFKEYGDDVSFLGVSSGNFVSISSVYRHIGLGSQSNAARFHERRINAVQYESPDLGPAEFKVQYSTNETNTAFRKPHVWSFGGQWEMGNLAILAGYEMHRDLFGLSANVPSSLRNSTVATARSKDTAVAIALKYKMGNHEFGLEANRLKYEEDGTAPGRVTSYRKNGYMFVWDARWSRQWRTGFHYVKSTAGKCSIVARDCNTNGLEGTQISAGAAYHFTRRTYLFFLAQHLKNDFSARFNSTDLQDVSAGEDVTQVAVGIHTSF